MKVTQKYVEIGPEDNLFEVLGFPKDEADQMLAETDRLIDLEKANKVQLADHINHWIKINNLTHEQAATRLRTSRARVSNVCKRSLDSFSIEWLTKANALIGKGVALAVR
jgi:predicted XRE-type DNA-binding protein